MSVRIWLFCVNVNSHKRQVELEVKFSLYFSSFCDIDYQEEKMNTHVKHSLISVEFVMVSTIDGICRNCSVNAEISQTYFPC